MRGLSRYHLIRISTTGSKTNWNVIPYLTWSWIALESYYENQNSQLYKKLWSSRISLRAIQRQLGTPSHSGWATHWFKLYAGPVAIPFSYHIDWSAYVL